MSNPFEDLVPSVNREADPFADLPSDKQGSDPFANLVPLPTSALSIAAKETAQDLRQMGAQFVRGAAGMVASVPESLGIVAHHMSGGLDSSGNPVPLEDVELYKAGQAIRRGAQWVAPVDETRPHKFAVDTLGQGAGSMAGAIGGGLIGGAAKLPAWVGVATTGATSQGVDAFDEAKAKGADDQTAWLTFLLNAGAGTSEAWLGPVAKWLDRANRSTHGAIRRAIREGAEEMGQELFQQISQNAIAQQLYDPDRPWLEGAGESSAAGLTLGTLGGLLFHGHAPRESVRRSPAAPASPQPEGRLPSRLPNDMEPVAGPDRPLPTTIPETPALQGPVAVFRGTRGEDLRVQIGTAGLDASKEYAMRVWPGAEFVGVEGEQAPPTPENPTTTNPTEGGESHVQTQEGRQEGVLTPAPTTAADASANASAPLAGSLSPEEQAQAQADLEATQSDPFADLTPDNPATQQPNETTDTAGKARERRGKGAGTTQSEPTETPVRVARGSSLRTRFARETETMGEDILSWISDNGRMMSRSAAQRSKSKEWWSQNKSLYDDAVKLKSPHHGIFYGGEQTPDQVADAAYRAGILKSPDVTALWAAIDKASAGRSGGVKAAKAEQEWIKSETAAQQNFQKATEDGAVRISSSELKVGDVLEVEGERVKVTAVDPDTLDVTLQDGRKFGTQVVPDGSTLHVEKLEHDEGGDWKVPSSSKPKEFSLDAPESVEQQKARQAAEQQQQAQQQAKAKIDALAAQPLTGNAGDLGQKDMFAPPEDLWAMQESGPIDNRKPQDQSTPSNETGRQNAGYKESVGQSQIQRLTEELRANSRANQEAQPGTSDYAAAYAGLLDLAQRTGRILPRDILPKHPIGQGQEHVVWWAPNHQRVFKSTLPNHFGLAIGKSTALTYLERMALQNEVFGDDIRFEGVVLDGQRMRIVTSQPAVVGSEVSESEAAAAMQRFGFVAGEISGQPIWYHPTGNVLAYDAHTRNFIKTKEGIVVPIDVILQYPTEDIRNALRSATGQDSLQELVREAAQELTGPESIANALLDESGGVAQDIAAEQRSDESVQRLKRINPRSGEAGFVINPATMIADLLVAGAKMLKRGGQWVMSKASWVGAMVKAYGENIRKHLDGVWSRLARIQNQQANGVGPTAQGHLNAIESLAGKSNIPEEQRPVYGPEVAAAGKPSMLTNVRPMSQQIRILGGQDLLKAKQRRDVLEATQAAAVKAQSDQLWADLVKSARESNPLKRWQLPDWMIATPRARAFKQRAIHIAARLNAVSRHDNGAFQFQDFVMRAGSMTTQEANRNKIGPGSQITLNDPITGQQDTLTVGQLVTPPSGGAFYQLHREVDAQTQQEIYEHFAREYPEMIWFLDMFIDPKLANTRTTINGIEIPVFNRFASAAMMAEGDPNFQPLTAYTPDVLVTRSLVGSVRSALSFKGGTRSPGRKYKSGTSREGGNVRDLLSGFNVRTWQMLAEKSRKQWMQAVLQAATPIRKNQIPNGWVKLETGMEDLWQAVKRLRNWKSPESWRPLKQSEIDELEELESKLGPNERIAKRDGRYFLVVTLFPETQARMTEKGIIEDEQLEYRKFFGEALALRGRQLMLPQALVDQLISRYTAHVEHGSLYRTAAWLVRNSVGLWLAAPVTYVNNVLTNDLFTVEAATRRILSGIAKWDMHDLRFARELAIAEGFKWFPGLRRLVDGQFRDAVDAVLPDNIFANQTALADLKVRLDEDPVSYLRRGELASAALQFIRYGNIDINSKRRMAFAWLRAQATTNARKAGLRGEALRAAVNGYLRNPPVDDRAAAIEIANFELLNYADSPEWLERFSANPASRLIMPFPRFGYHYIAKNATRAAALKDLLGKVPQKQRAESFADFVTFLMFPAGGLGLLAHLLFGGDDDDARKLVGTSQTKEMGPDGEISVKPIDRSLVTANRVNLTGWARQLGLGDPNRETDFWLRVRSYPVVSMAGAAVLAMNDTKKFGPKEGAMTYARAAMDLASDFFSVGMAVKVPDKVVQTLSDRSGGKNPPQMVTDPYGTRVPFLAYLTDQTLETFIPGSRQADMMIRWLDPVQRRRSASKALDFTPSMWDAARVGHWTGLLDRLWSGGPSTLPPEGPVKRGFVEPQSYPLTQRVAELGGFNIRPIDRRAYEEAIKLGPRW